MWEGRLPVKTEYASVVVGNGGVIHRYFHEGIIVSSQCLPTHAAPGETLYLNILDWTTAVFSASLSLEGALF
jgi:hypothetical protein